MPVKARFVAPLLWSLLSILIGLAPVAAAPVTVILKWTAPGDDGLVGKATRYDLRYSTVLLTATTFASGRSVLIQPTPTVSGGTQTYFLSGLSPDSTYFIALKSCDEAGNWSPISNILVRPHQTLGVDDGASRIAFSEPRPNPARTSVRLSFNLSRAAAIQVDVYDIVGRRVRSLENAWHGAGTVPIEWDLQDEQGRRVSPGAYLVMADALGRRWTKRLVVL